jgi:hypothetical protein
MRAVVSPLIAQKRTIRFPPYRARSRSSLSARGLDDRVRPTHCCPSNSQLWQGWNFNSSANALQRWNTLATDPYGKNYAE